MKILSSKYLLVGLLAMFAVPASAVLVPAKLVAVRANQELNEGKLWTCGATIAFAANESQSSFDLAQVLLSLTFTPDFSMATIAYLVDVAPKANGQQKRSKGAIKQAWFRLGDKDALASQKDLIPTGTGYVAALSSKQVVQGALEELVAKRPRLQVALELEEPIGSVIYTGTPVVSEETKSAILDCLREMNARGLYKGD